MLIFNTTFHLEKTVSADCLTFFKQEYIPRALESKLVSNPVLMQVHANHGESGVSYALQFKVESIKNLEEWIINTGEGLQKELVARFGDKVASFVTLLEEVDIN